MKNILPYMFYVCTTGYLIWASFYLKPWAVVLNGLCLVGVGFLVASRLWDEAYKKRTQSMRTYLTEAQGKILELQGQLNTAKRNLYILNNKKEIE